MVKVKCDKCGSINHIQKDADHYYCNQCGEKNHYEPTKKKKNSKWLLFVLIPVFFIGIFLIVAIPVRQYGSNIKISEVEKYCKSSKKCSLKKVFKKHLFSIAKYKIVEDVQYNGIDKKYTFKVKQFGKTKKYKFKLIDDAGPKISPNKVILDYQGEISFDSKLIINDFVEGEISLDSKKVKINSDKVKIDKEGTYEVVVTAYDSKKNKTTKTIKAVVKKAVPKEIKLLLKPSYERNETITLEAEVLPETAFDKSLVWKVNGETIESNTTSFSEGGQYQICAYSKVNEDVGVCDYIGVNKECLSRYEFTLDGSSSKTLYVGKYKDLCPGTYRVTGYTINNTICPSVRFNLRGQFDVNSDFMTVCYSDPSNGKIHVLADNTHIDIDLGYTKVVFALS